MIKPAVVNISISISKSLISIPPVKTQGGLLIFQIQYARPSGCPDKYTICITGYHSPGILFVERARIRNFLCGSGLFQAVLFDVSQYPVQRHGYYAQNQDGHKDGGKFKGLAGVDDQIPQSFPCSDEFADDDAHKAQAQC